MAEIIHIHIGQAGVQIGNACWDLYLKEHGIQKDGKQLQADQQFSNCDSLFREVPGEKYQPRAIHIDLEPSVIDEIRQGTSKHLFNPGNLITGKQDAASNYCKGHYSDGREIIDKSLNKIRNMAEQCDNLQGFMITNSLGGGTGSGFGSLLTERLSVDFRKKTKFGVIVYPSSRLASSIVEPYNSTLASHSLFEHHDLTVTVDNQSLYGICDRSLGVESPNYHNINKMIASSISSLTSSMRFSGPLNTNMNEINTNLVPYPRIHFMCASHAPWSSEDSYQQIDQTVHQITQNVFNPTSLMVGADPRQGKYMACCLLYNGDVTPVDAVQAIKSLKSNNNIRFVDWVPTGFKVGINARQPVTDKTNRAVSMFCNTTSLRYVFARINQQFDKLYAKRAFVHWFVCEGMESDEFAEAREDSAALVKDYEEVEQETEQQ